MAGPLKSKFIAKIEKLLKDAPYSEYTHRNLSVLQRMQKHKLEQLNSEINKISTSDEVQNSGSSSSMNLPYVISREAKYRKNVDHGGLRLPEISLSYQDFEDMKSRSIELRGKYNRSMKGDRYERIN